MARTQKWTAPQPGSHTARDEQGRRYELSEGTWTERLTAGSRHGLVEGEVVFRLRRYLSENPLGKLVCGNAGFELAEDCLLAPDVAFLARERLARTPLPETGVYPGPPDLVVEVRSPDDQPGELIVKVGQYLQAGVRVVWVVDPHRRTVTLYRTSNDVTVLQDTDVLHGEDVLPGFACPVAELID